MELEPLRLGPVGPPVPLYRLTALPLDKQVAALEEKDEPSIGMFGELGGEDLVHQTEVAVVGLAGVEGEEEVVAEEDDAGEKVSDAVLVVIAFHELGQTHGLKHYGRYYYASQTR